MTPIEPEELLRQGRMWGWDDAEELTFGELTQLLESAYDRERRVLQGLALVAHRHALLTGMVLSGQKLPEVWEIFPFWSDEEIRRAKVERYQQMMHRLAGTGHGKEQDAPCASQTAQ